MLNSRYTRGKIPKMIHKQCHPPPPFQSINLCVINWLFFFSVLDIGGVNELALWLHIRTNSSRDARGSLLAKDYHRDKKDIEERIDIASGGYSPRETRAEAKRKTSGQGESGKSAPMNKG